MTIDIFYLNDNGTKSPAIAPFYESSNGLYSLTNFSKDAVTIDGKTYESTEVFFQREKFKGNKPILDKFDSQVKSAKQALTFAKAHTQHVEPQWHIKNKFIVMERALREKLKQHPEIETQLKDTGNACLVEDTTSSEFEEAIWGWGRKNGTNHLGLLWMKLRNELFEQEGRNRLIVNPKKLYKQVQDIRTKVLPKLAGATINSAYPCMQTLARTNPALIQKASPAPTNTATTSSRPITSRSTDPKPARASSTGKTAEQRVLEKIPGAISVKAGVDLQRPSDKVLKVVFPSSSTTAIHSFRQANGNIPDRNVTHSTNGFTTIILGQDRANFFLNKNGISTHGKSNPRKMLDALNYDQKTVGNKRPRNPIPITTFSAYLPSAQTSSSTDPQTPAANNAQRHSSTYNPAPHSAHARVLEATGYGDGWITDLKITANKNSKHPPVLKITFCSDRDANAFFMENSKSITAGGPGLNLPKSDNPNVVILPKSEADKFFAFHKITTHGKAQRTMWSSLEWEENNTNNNNPKRPRPSM